MHAAVEAELTDIQDAEDAAAAARTRSRTLTTVPSEAEVWYNATRDVFHVRHSWFSEDGNGYSTDLEDACRWFDRAELEAIRAAELAAVAAKPE